MAHADRAPSPLNRQLPASTARKLLHAVVLSSDQLLSSALRYGLLTLYVATVYTVVLAVGGITGGRTVPWWLNLVALLIIVPTFLPMHSLLQRSVNQLVYGQHDNPYALLTQFNQHLNADADPTALLPTIAATIAATLKLPYVALDADLKADGRSGSYGVPPPHAEIVSLPLTYGTTLLGALRASARRPHERLSADDTRLLADLARQVGITLHAAQLTEALQASRAQLVLAREEERRRIRRDLHDGLGPTLASLRLQLSALRKTVRQSPDEAERLIDDLRDDVRAATAEIRRLVYDLRPPMLDEFGLVGALRNFELTDDGLTRSVMAPATLPPLPAAVEVTVYRIAAEALHNIVRHAQATHCTVRLAVDAAALTLTVTDNGRGLPASYLPGVGHRSMHERAAELGGSVTILPAPIRGTCVTATFRFQEVPDA